jgi:DNA-binding NarL/FixJ family response regulator
LLDAIRAGAARYVLKDATRQQLLDAVRGVLDGEFPLDQNLAMRLLRRLAGEEAERGEPRREEAPPEPEKKAPEPLLEPLTPRETEVLSLLARGRTNREIAETLVISLGTARLHVHRVINKLGASDRIQAAIRAIRFGLPSLN